MNVTHTHRHRTLRAAAITGLAGALSLGFTGCKGKTSQAQVVSGQDPAEANLAQPYTGGPAGQAKVLGQSDAYNGQSSGESYETQAPAPIIRQAPAGTQSTQYYPVPQAQQNQAGYQQGYYQGDPNQQGYAGQPGYDQGYSDAEEAGEQALAETDQAPPPLPEYDQPPAPADNYIWTPGYWNYAQTGYYWVPGAWCAPPFYGALWTPPYWGYYNNHYLFHRGYWGPHVGYYGGINYGFGYIGFGYFGGYWRDRNFYYNRAVSNVNVGVVHNFYQRQVVYNNRTYGPHPDNRISYNGGRGGLNVQPRPQEMAAMREAHYAPVAAQRENRLAAAGNRGQFFNSNHGAPAQAFAGRPIGNAGSIATTPREQAFNRPGANNAAGSGGRPGNFNRPGGTINQPGNNGARPGEFARPGNANQPAFNNGGRSGEFNRPGNAAQPGNASQPAFNNGGRAGEFNRPGNATQPGNANQPAFNNGGRPGEFNRPGNATQPGNANQPGNPGNFNRPSQPGNAPGNFHRPAENNQPSSTGGRPGGGDFNRPNAGNQGNFNGGRPGGFERPSAPSQPAAQPRPNFDAGRQAQPQFQQRSAPAAAPAARPEAAPRAAAPAPHAEAPRGGGGGGGSAPHGGGGGDHGHH